MCLPSFSDWRPPGRGPGPEDTGALLPHLTRRWASICRRRRGEDAFQKGPQPEQEHLLGHPGDAARPVSHTAHRTGVQGGGSARTSFPMSSSKVRCFGVGVIWPISGVVGHPGGHSAVQRVQGVEGGADTWPELLLPRESLPGGHLPLPHLQQERGKKYLARSAVATRPVCWGKGIQLTCQISKIVRMAMSIKLLYFVLMLNSRPSRTCGFPPLLKGNIFSLGYFPLACSLLWLFLILSRIALWFKNVKPNYFNITTNWTKLQSCRSLIGQRHQQFGSKCQLWRSHTRRLFITIIVTVNLRPFTYIWSILTTSSMWMALKWNRIGEA